MATYKDIQGYIMEHHGVIVKTCWIADMKEMHGLPKKVAPNRISMSSKTNPCPNDKKGLITEAFKNFGMI